MLEASTKNSRVELDLTEYVQEGSSLDDVISGSLADLGQKVQLYQRTFDGIIGRE
jgi:hypothetical protein